LSWKRLDLMSLFVYSITSGLVLGGIGAARALSSAKRRKRERVQAADFRQELEDTCPEIVSQLGEFAAHPPEALTLALKALRDSEREDDHDHPIGEPSRGMLAWLDFAPQKLIFDDLLQLQAVLSPHGPWTYLEHGEQYHLIRQFGIMVEANFIADLTFRDFRNKKVLLGKIERPSLDALKMLAAAGSPARETLRDLYRAFAQLCAEPEAKHLSYLLEEIRRAARTAKEIEAEPPASDREQDIRWARYISDLHAIQDTTPEVVGALAGYADRLQSGLTEAIRQYKNTNLVIPEGLSVVNLMLMDLCEIISKLSEDLNSPTIPQADLLKRVIAEIGISGASTLNGKDIATVIETGSGAGLLGLSVLAETGHPDRFVLQESYLQFAKEASRHCEMRLPDVEKMIVEAAMTPTESAESGRNPESLTSLAPAEIARRVLGVAESASAAEIKQAYHRHVQLWHPDRLSGMAPELQVLANERLAQVNEAYSALRAGMA
jgi:hypothetical protein